MSQIKVFLQARMSSKRLPGKILEDLAGKPLLMRVYENVSKVFSADEILFVTSSEMTDNPLCDFLKNQNLNFFRGSLNDVLLRFYDASKIYPSKWVARICCDSPMISPDIIRLVRQACIYSDKKDTEGYDLVTNTFPRSFPKGQSVEIINCATLHRLQQAVTNSDHREHVTKYIYDNPKEFKILNVANPKGNESNKSDVVDTPEDLQAMRERFQSL